MSDPKSPRNRFSADLTNNSIPDQEYPFLPDPKDDGRKPHASPLQNQQQCNSKRGNGLPYSIILGSQTPHPFSDQVGLEVAPITPRASMPKYLAIADTGAQSGLWSLTDFLAYSFSCDKLHTKSRSFSVVKHSPRFIEGAFFANLVTQSDCGKVTSCHSMVYVEALSRICACLTTRHSASDFSCGSNRTNLKERLLTNSHTLHQKFTHPSTGVNKCKTTSSARKLSSSLSACHMENPLLELVSSQVSKKAPLWQVDISSLDKFCQVLSHH